MTTEQTPFAAEGSRLKAQLEAFFCLHLTKVELQLTIILIIG